MKAEIYITLKNTVVDPQGLVIKHALESLNFAGISKVRSGKIITIELDSDSKEDVEKEVDLMCKKLLSNLIIEDYRFQIEK